MLAIARKICAYIMAMLCSLLPVGDYDVKNSDEILMNTAIISDVHIDAELPFGKARLTAGLYDVKRNKTPNDALVVVGDLTNYGDTASVDAFYSIVKNTDSAEKYIIMPGNHDIGHAEELTNKQARDRFIEYNNELTNAKNKNPYYSTTVNGYKFIVLCDESEDNWDTCEISKKQTDFLDAELKKGTKNGKPVFVLCHWPVEGPNGQDVVYEDSCIRSADSKRIKKILEKYKNVFYISGHIHKGVSGEIFEKVFGFSSTETVNGVNYVSVPSFGIANRYGVPWHGMGMQMEVYKNQVIFRPRSYFHSMWYESTEYTFTLVK